MTISVRLPRIQQAALVRLAKTKGRTQSDLVRDAVELLLETESGGETPKSPYEAMAHLIGCADSGGKEALSESTGRRFAAMMEEKARARRRSR
jgi:Arc/MetJ-type ribon-helix-helix transcriptional regulator